MISREQMASFRQDGYVIIPDVIDDEQIACLRVAHDELLERWSIECEVERDEYERVVSQWTNLHRQDERFRAQIAHPVVLRIARELLGASALQLFHDHFISKPPGVSSTIPWHQDYPFWPIDKPRAISCWLALDDADETSGSMTFMPGAHLEGECPPADFLKVSKDWGPRLVESRSTTLKAGSAVFHDCLSWHCSPPNTSANARRAFITIFMDHTCRWQPEHSDWHPMNDHVTGVPGDTFNTDYFPVFDEV